MFGIDMGPSSQEQGQYSALSNAGNFGINEGEGDINAGTNFMKGIVSGDAAKIAQTLAPQIGNAKTAAQQTNKTAAEMGTRSGGTAASTAATNDKVNSDITGLIGNLTGSAVSGLTNTGTSLFGTGTSATGNAFGEAQTMQQQRAAKWNDIAKSTAAVAAAPFTGGASLSSLGSSPGGGSPGGGGAPAPSWSIPSWMKGSSAPSDDGGDMAWGF